MNRINTVTIPHEQGPYTLDLFDTYTVTEFGTQIYRYIISGPYRVFEFGKVLDQERDLDAVKLALSAYVGL